MTEEKFENLQELGGECAIAEFIFDLQRFEADDAADDADDTTDDTTDDATDDADDTTDDATDDADDTTDDATDDADDTTDDATDDTSDDTSDDTADDTSDDTADDSDGDSDITYDLDDGKSTTEQNEAATKDYTNDSSVSTLISDSSSVTAVTTSDDGELVVVSASTGSASITSGKGEDTLVVQDSAAVTFDVSKSTSADKVIMANDGVTTKLTMKGYKASLGGGFVTGETNMNSLRAGVVGGGITFGNGAITIHGANDGQARVTLDSSAGTSGSSFFNLYDASGEEMQAVGFTHKEGGVLDASKLPAEDYMLVGNYSDKKTAGSTITGGKGDDSVLGGGGDVINAGSGENMIRLVEKDGRDSAKVVVTEGRNRIYGVNNTFDEGEGDVIQVSDFSNANVSFGENGLEIKGDGYRATLAGLEPTDGVVTQMFESGSNTVKAAIATEAGTVLDASIGANHFQGNNTDGNNSAVTFANFDGAVNVDLTGNSSIGSNAATFKDIKIFQAGDYDTTLRGGDNNETLIAGTGDGTLYGGGGRNLMQGNAGSADRDGRTAFFVLGATNGAQNTVTGFQFADDVEDNSLADVVEIGVSDGNYVSNVYLKNDNQDVVMEVSNRAGTATERVQVAGATGKNMYVTDTLVAQVNTTSLTYDGDATFFVATGKNASIAIDNDSVTQATMWMDGKPDGTGGSFKGDIKTIDGRGFDGKAELAGSADVNNTIYGGAGSNSLWGGNGGDDLLVGGTGQNLFFYTSGNGNDTIEGVNDGDVVYLAAVTFENIAGTDFSNGAITINFNDGGKLTINDEGKEVGVVVGDQTYYVNSGRTDFTTER